ncbi:MAG TPA: RsmE family RNA methyltransferase [Candidatus Sulfotelmatobacter sp.]|nr:RsmE family RNA methyltransferase [Candidatus Sulfotelmatobacter sp.]
MTRRRWIADEVSGNRAALTGDHAHHLIRVLRARTGQEFDIVANGVLYNAAVDTISEDRVEFELKAEIPASTPAPVTILLSIFKFDRMEWAIEKCTELGVSKIIPVIARRTDAHLASASAKRVDRWRRIAMQASEQSRRASQPEISQPARLQDALEIPGAFRIVLAESETHSTLRGLVASNSSKEVALAIGPEGGWTSEELDAFNKEGWALASLGPTILRAETAAIVATAVAILELSE